MAGARLVTVDRYSATQRFGCLEGQLVQPSADIAIEFGLAVEQTAACRQTVDLFAKPSAAVELELAELEQLMCSAAWIAAVAALDLERNVKVETNWGLVDRFGKVA